MTFVMQKQYYPLKSIQSASSQKMKFSIKDFFSKFDQIRWFGHIYYRNP